MILQGALANSAGVLIAGLIGSLFSSSMPKRVHHTLIMAIGLAVTYTGLSGAFRGTAIIMLMLSLAIGGVIGGFLDLEGRIERGAKMLEQRFVQHQEGANSRFAEGLIACTIVTCVGGMAIVGAIDSGMRHDFGIYYAKTVLDMIFVFVMATAMGRGCAFSSFPLLIYQGALTLGASFIAQFLTDAVITDMSVVGSFLIVGIGLNMLKATDIPIANFLLAPFAPIILHALYGLWPF